MALFDESEPPSPAKTKENKDNNLNTTKTSKLAFERANSFLKRQKDILENKFDEFRTGIIRFFVSGRYLPHFVIIFLLFLTLTVNLGESARASSIYEELVYVSPDSEALIVSSIDPYTLQITADLNTLIDAEESGTEDGFAKNVTSIETTVTEKEEPVVVPSLPDNSSSTITYTVLPGDTLTGLGWKFGVKISTLTYLNEIANVDSIKPGSKLKIPPKGYEVSASLIAKKQKEAKAKQLAQAQRNTVVRNSSTSRQVYTGDVGSGSGSSLSVPINSTGISRGFTSYHFGIDYRASVGTAVKAAADGVVSVTSRGWSGGYGNMILLSHGGGLATRYGHLNQIAVSPGQSVSEGQVIGYSGNTGNSTGPHLHFEKIINGRPVRPF